MFNSYFIPNINYHMGCSMILGQHMSGSLFKEKYIKLVTWKHMSSLKMKEIVERGSLLNSNEDDFDDVQSYTNMCITSLGLVLNLIFYIKCCISRITCKPSLNWIKSAIKLLNVSKAKLVNGLNT